MKSKHLTVIKRIQERKIPTKSKIFKTNNLFYEEKEYGY